MSEGPASRALAEALPMDVERLSAQVQSVLDDALYWLPVRHHAPGAARVVRDAIRARRPAIVFIEGPAEATTYVDWATLLRRVFSIDALECPRCGGRLRFIATISEQPAITKILDALGLPSDPPVPQARAADPQVDLDPVMSVA